MSAPKSWINLLAPLAVALLAAGMLIFVFRGGPDEVPLRLPADRARDPGATEGPSPLESAKTIAGPGTQSDLPGAWPAFRGPNRDGISTESVPLLDAWPDTGPAMLWSVAVGEGYAGPVVHEGRVYLMDYDREAQADALRCLSLADGREIWRFTYPVEIKRNHGMSRTVPAIAGGLVVSLGPMGHVSCVDAKTGEFRWGVDLVREHGTTIPPWYAGQCPLIDGDRVILAPAGTPPDGPLLTALDLATGKPAWSTPNTLAWKMTHASIAVAEIEGVRHYVYCGHRGVAGVSAEDGTLLWSTPEWKISIATVPTPVPLPDGRLFLSGGYKAGSMMLQVRSGIEGWAIHTTRRLDDETFGATQQTPIYYEDRIFGVRPDGELTCLSPDGGVCWTSGPKHRFGLGPFMIADGKLLVMDDHGELTLAAASTERFEPLARAKVLEGHDSWGPMALAGGRLIVRDLTEMRCLDLRADPAQERRVHPAGAWAPRPEATSRPFPASQPPITQDAG
jgi:outer membrane protein assembly factor BamB